MGNTNFPSFILFFAISHSCVMGLYMKSFSGLNGEFARKEKEMKWLFSEWKVKYDKSYDHPTEESRRFQIFKSNLRYITEHNRPENNHSFTLALNQFADLTPEDFSKIYLNSRSHKLSFSHPSDRYVVREGENLPNSVDWRTEGAVTPVENQGPFGSCWAFSAAGAVEGINQIVTGELLTLSKQNLVDCDKENFGCSSGSATSAFKYIEKHGINIEYDYPYQGEKQTCTQFKDRVVYIDSFETISRCDEDSLRKAVSNQPVSVIMQSNSTDFIFYDKGIFGGRCGPRVDHWVLVVGYGSENGIDYWIVKNSWGEIWGENGYVKIERGGNGEFGKCHIAYHPSYPIKDQPYKFHGKPSKTI